jgi:NAD(P)-dependent dehydrogenase (short-subunit alcohol dehydrogenase family)
MTAWNARPKDPSDRAEQEDDEMGILARLRPVSGLRAVVTAGAGGIGRAIAEALVEAGATVHVGDVDVASVDAFAAAGPGRSGAVCDVSDPAAVDALMEGALHRMGGLDVLVNNAGIAGPTGRIDEIEPDDWKRTVDVNLDGQFLVARRAVPALRESRGTMINISSVAGRLGYAYRTPYAASKWGVVGLTKSLAIELGPDGVRVNAILPGIVEGPRIDRVIAARAEALGISFEEMRERYLDKVSLRRMVTPEDVAATCLFLCSPAGATISGQAISVCGNVETL